MEPNPHGDRAHIPLPSNAPRGAALSAGRLAPARAASQAAAAVIAVAVAGGAVWFFGRPKPAPPPSSSSILSISSVEMTAAAPPETASALITAPPSTLEDRPASPQPAREGVSGGSPSILPEPPTLDAPPADTASALPAEAMRLSPAAASALFGRSAGGFSQWKNDHVSHPVVSVVNTPRSGGAPPPMTAAPPYQAPHAVASAPARTPASALRPRAFGSPAPAGAGWSSPHAAYSTPQSPAAGPAPGAQAIGMPAQAANGSGGYCPDCNQAIDSGYTNDRPHEGRPVGTLALEGRCKDGYIYRVTNTNGVGLPSHLVSNDGEVWNVGSLQPGQTMVIHSSELLSQAAFMNL